MQLQTTEHLHSLLSSVTSLLYCKQGRESVAGGWERRGGRGGKELLWREGELRRSQSCDGGMEENISRENE